MRVKQPRWEREAERLRESGPAWFDADRLPWVLWLLLGLGFAARGVYLLVAGDGVWDRFLGAGLLAFVSPAQFRAASRRRRGSSLWGGGR